MSPPSFMKNSSFTPEFNPQNWWSFFFLKIALSSLELSCIYICTLINLHKAKKPSHTQETISPNETGCTSTLQYQRKKVVLQMPISYMYICVCVYMHTNRVVLSKNNDIYIYIYPTQKLVFQTIFKTKSATFWFLKTPVKHNLGVKNDLLG